MNEKPQALLIIGPTGAGKTPLGDFFENQKLDSSPCHHLDFGNELRRISQQAQPVAPFTPDEQQFVIDVLEKGRLLENEHFYLAIKIINSFLKRVNFCKKDILILNGIPRHKEQADDVAQIINIRGIVELICYPHVIYERIHKNTGGDRTNRVDDKHHMIEKKIEIYTKRTSALVNYYKDKGCKVYSIEVSTNTRADDLYRTFLSQYMQSSVVSNWAQIT